jgi:hypothetical protein
VNGFPIPNWFFPDSIASFETRLFRTGSLENSKGVGSLCQGGWFIVPRGLVHCAKGVGSLCQGGWRNDVATTMWS